MGEGAIFAISDLHVEHEENLKAVEGFRPEHSSDWLLVGGDVANDPDLVERALAVLRRKFRKVVWAPGNHELHASTATDGSLRGEARYLELVRRCRAVGVVTPEDPYPIWDGAWGPIRIVPLFLLYDYSFRDQNLSQGLALRRAFEAGVVCDDEFVLDPYPHVSRQTWCEARVTESVRRLESLESVLPSVLLNHYPLRVEPTRALLRPEFAQWCGTLQTKDWHRRFRAAAVVYGHLHIPRTTWHDGVPFEEVSLGYPKEWRRRGEFHPPRPRRILPRA